MLQMTMKTMFTMLVVLPELAESCAFRFISEEDAIYATDLVKAFELSELVVRDDLKAVADSIIAKVNRGLGQAHGTGHGGVALNLMKRRIRRGKQLRSQLLLLPPTPRRQLQRQVLFLLLNCFQMLDHLFLCLVFLAYQYLADSPLCKCKD